MLYISQDTHAKAWRLTPSDGLLKATGELNRIFRIQTSRSSLANCFLRHPQTQISKGIPKAGKQELKWMSTAVSTYMYVYNWSQSDSVQRQQKENYIFIRSAVTVKLKNYNQPVAQMLVHAFLFSLVLMLTRKP